MLTDARLTLRKATRADAAPMIEMINAMAACDEMPPLDQAAQQRLVRDAFERHRFEMVIADFDGKAVGFASYFETYSTFEARPTLYVDDLYVQADYRGRHVGYELFRYCLREAQRRDCGRMEWLVHQWNRSAFGFYERLNTRRLEGWTHFRLSRLDIDRMA